MALGFAFRSGSEGKRLLCGMAVGFIALLLMLARSSLWLLTRYSRASD